MKIHWSENPLYTVVELDDADKRLLRERIKSDDLLERICSAWMDLDPEHQMWTREHCSHLNLNTTEDFIAEARRQLDYEFVSGDGDAEDVERSGETYQTWLDGQMKWSLEALAGAHDGDCVCQPCSCIKCRTERLLGIDTIEGLDKYGAHYVGLAFADGRATIGEALAWLTDHVPEAEEDWERPHIDRWRREARGASEWLSAYRAKHFPEPTP